MPGLVFGCASLWFSGHNAKGQVAESPSLRGTVMDAAGRPVSGASVLLKAAGASSKLSTQTSADGTYSFARIETGVDYELSARFQGLASAVTPLRVSNADERVSSILQVVPPIQFEDIAAKAGIAFTLRNGARGRSYQPEIMLGGVAALDYDNDGCTDIFFTNGAAVPSDRKSTRLNSSHPS